MLQYGSNTEVQSLCLSLIPYFNFPLSFKVGFFENVFSFFTTLYSMHYFFGAHTEKLCWSPELVHEFGRFARGHSCAAAQQGGGCVHNGTKKAKQEIPFAFFLK